MTAAPRIALIHATALSIPPVNDAFRRLWPEARLANLLDDTLSVDRARDGVLTDAMVGRFRALAHYVINTGAEAILFTCSAFGEAIDAVKADHPGRLILKPNEAMIDLALEQSGQIGMVATFLPTVSSVGAEFETRAAELGIPLSLKTSHAAGAMEALDDGDGETHDARIVEAAAGLDGDLVVLPQFSMARSAPLVRQRIGRPVITTPDAAVQRLRTSFEAY